MFPFLLLFLNQIKVTIVSKLLSLEGVEEYKVLWNQRWGSKDTKIFIHNVFKVLEFSTASAIILKEFIEGQ